MPVPDCGTPSSQTAQHGLDSDLPPDSHGAPTRLLVTTTLDALRDGLGSSLAHDALNELSVATIRRLACDAEIIPAVLGSTGEPLDVGRAKRLVTAAIWVALVLRDQHCGFPGCDRPPLMCHAHHIRHWITGGNNQTRQPRLAVRPPPPHPPPHTLGSPHQPPRPPPRIPTTTQTRRRKTLDPTSTTPRIAVTASGRGPRSAKAGLASRGATRWEGTCLLEGGSGGGRQSAAAPTLWCWVVSRRSQGSLLNHRSQARAPQPPTGVRRRR